MVSFLVTLSLYPIQVSEAIQIGARAIKDNSISIEEVHAHLQELDESVASQKQVEEALGKLLLFP